MKILMALAFYPRGGAAQVVRYLAQALTNNGHEVRIVSGSLKEHEPSHDASRFFEGLSVVEVDYTNAARGFAQGLNPMSNRFSTPFHPSYEDKTDVPDRVFYRVTRSELEHLVANWEQVLSRATSDFQPDVAHLHHLNHVHIAAARSPALANTPKIAHLHGTELKMLDAIESPADVPASQRRMWSEALRDTASLMDQHVAISTDNVDRAIRILGLEREQIALIPNGVDTQLFSPLGWDPRQKLAQLETLLVNSPHAWDESGAVGSIRYDRSDLGSFLDSSGNMKPLLVFVGRFLGFKRVPLLLDAVTRANRQLARNGDDESRFNLLVLGGVPGEWEGEHPHTAATRLGLRNVFFGGWLSHRELTKALNVADAFVAPSYFEPFGQVFLEAMATGLPVLATRSGGPLSFVNGDGPLANGWLCDVDDPDSLARVIVLSVSRVPERQRRGQNALELVRSEYAWATIAGRFEALYRQLQAMKRSSLQLQDAPREPAAGAGK